MSFFDLLKKVPSGAAQKKSVAGHSIPLPLGEMPDRAKRETGEGEFQASNCAIWNDIQRALESK